MRDFATSGSPAVQAQLDRLARLSLPDGRLGLETITALLARLGNPHHDMPPAFHVAGTNGKGSTCAFLRAMLEAQGLRVHAATSPHLVRYNERIRLAGRLIADDLLAELLCEVLDRGADLSPSFFEATIATTFLAFSRIPADACVIEVGLGGRFDATNVLADPLVCGIASLGIDHERFLLAPEPGAPAAPLARIAFEKAGIAKPGVPLVTQAYGPDATAQIVRAAQRAGAAAIMRDRDWFMETDAHLHYRDGQGSLTLPLPAMAGRHQSANAGLAVAMIRHQSRIAVATGAMAAGIASAHWPARMQRLRPGPLASLVPRAELILDGAHNPDAMQALDDALDARIRPDVVIGLLSNRDVTKVLAPLARRIGRLWAVPVPEHEHHDPSEICRIARDALGIASARPASDTAEALRGLAGQQAGDDGRSRPTVLIVGSLYLAGKVLEANGEIPD